MVSLPRELPLEMVKLIAAAMNIAGTSESKKDPSIMEAIVVMEENNGEDVTDADCTAEGMSKSRRGADASISSGATPQPNFTEDCLLWAGALGAVWKSIGGFGSKPAKFKDLLLVACGACIGRKAWAPASRASSIQRHN